MGLFEEAVLFAVKAHEGQKRKFSDAPYIVHPMEAAAIASSVTGDEEVLAAVLLHDVLEDTSVTAEQLEAKFGPRVLALVRSETEPVFEQPLEPGETWLARKKASLSVLHESTDPGTAVMWVSDKLSNIRSFRREQLAGDPEPWLHLHQKDPRMQRWYYETILRETAHLAGTPAYIELRFLVNLVFSDIPKEENDP